MRQVELVPGIKSSILGFGCAPILGAVDGRTAEIAVNTALDLGISHFDLARSYGFGEAERFVGRLLKPRRDSVTIATKFGIYANWRSVAFRPLKPLARLLKRLRSKKTLLPIETQRENPRHFPDLFHSNFPLDAKSMVASLHKSLREMRTDRVELLMIHEPQHTIERIQEMLAASERLKEQGKIRAFGLASPDWDDVRHRAYASYFDVLQFARPEISDFENMLQSRRNHPNILFAPYRNAETKVDVFKNLHLQMPNSVILCSMFNPNHIRLNANALTALQNECTPP